MPQPNKYKYQFWKELRRRKVLRRMMVYAASAFLILELVSIIAEPFGLPDWTLKFVFVILCLGLIISAVLSWFYDFTPDGLDRIKPANVAMYDHNEKHSQVLAWKITSYISIVIIIFLMVYNIARGVKQSETLIDLEKSIAVLPFENMSVDSEFPNFGDAMTDEIITQLKIIKDLRVISRTSTLRYKNTDMAISAIGEELNVNYLVEGSVQRQNNKVRFRVRLVTVENENQLWTDTYDKAWQDIFIIQSDIAQQIAHELQAVLSPEEIQKIDRPPTENLDAYDLFLQGRYFWGKRTEEGILEAIEFFNNAIEIDANYALAYAGLADCYTMGSLYGYLPVKDGIQRHIQKAKDAALKAIEIDNTLAEAHTSLASCKFHLEWDWRGAIKDFERAIQLNPGYETAHQWYSHLLSVFKQFDKAIYEVKRAQELDPFSSVINSAVVKRLYHSRRYDQAIKESQRALKLTPDYFLTHQYLGLAYLEKGMYTMAIIAMQKAVRYSGGNLITKAYLGYTYGVTDNQYKAHAIINELREESHDVYVPAIAYALIYNGLGDKNRAISWLEKAYSERTSLLIDINMAPEYDPLRSDPGFTELLLRMNFE